MIEDKKQKALLYIFNIDLVLFCEKSQFDFWYFYIFLVLPLHECRDFASVFWYLLSTHDSMRPELLDSGRKQWSIELL